MVNLVDCSKLKPDVCGFVIEAVDKLLKLNNGASVANATSFSGRVFIAPPSSAYAGLSPLMMTNSHHLFIL